MGPILICDKSTLQGLSRAELNMLRRNYSLNVPPVLLMEVLGDLKKASDLAACRHDVRRLAEKLVPFCVTINIGFRDIVFGEITGKPVAVDGRPIIRAGRSVTSQGEAGMILEETAEEEALLRWQRGEFLEAENILASRWREAVRAIDLQSLQAVLREQYTPHQHFSSFAEIAGFADKLLLQMPPSELLSWFLRDCEFILDNLQETLATIGADQAFSLVQRFPYTARCIRLALIFHFALAFGLISTRASNRVDLEYLYYVPFCHVFSSGDLLHKSLVGYILREDQVFIERSVLKADLEGLALWWRSLSETDKEVERQRSGPPPFHASQTYLIWKRFMRPDYRERSLERKIPPEVGEKMSQHISNLMKNATTAGNENISLDDCTFVARKHMVRIDGPCICGSDKIFALCCGREIVGALRSKKEEFRSK